MKSLSEFVKAKGKEIALTQEELAERSGVALTVIRKIEQGKENLNLEKVNHVLKMFGHVLVSSRDIVENNVLELFEHSLLKFPLIRKVIIFYR